jgi:RNA polymerase sigma factor (sigma-70 family)
MTDTTQRREGRQPRSDGDAFADFYRTQYPHAAGLARLLTNGSSDSEDAVQDAFARLGPRFTDVEHPIAYLRTAIVNACREAHRRRQREARRVERVLAQPLAAAGEPALPDAQLLALVDALPYPQRATLVLRYWADAPDPEIAEVLGVRPATVRSLAHRAMRRLHRELSS